MPRQSEDEPREERCPEGRKWWYCQDCDYKTNRKRIFSDHVSGVHFKEKKYKCDTCDFDTSYHSGLKNHNRKSRKHWTCSICSYVTYLDSRLETHQLERHGIQPRVVVDPRKAAAAATAKKKAQNEKQQRKEREANSTVWPKLLSCPKCPYSTKYVSNLEDHKAELHGETPTLACSLCDFSTQDEEALSNHILATHGADRDNPKCALCNFSTESSADFVKHRELHSERDVSMTCEHCDFVGDGLRAMDAHVMDEHDEWGRSSCEMCSFSAWHAPTAVAHAKVHDAELMEIMKQGDNNEHEVLAAEI